MEILQTCCCGGIGSTTDGGSTCDTSTTCGCDGGVWDPGSSLGWGVTEDASSCTINK